MNGPAPILEISPLHCSAIVVPKVKYKMITVLDIRVTVCPLRK